MFKRAFDFLFSLMAMLALMPVYFVLSISVFLFLGRPLFFSQLRAGRGGRPFKLYKFRSMSGGANLDDSLRIGRFGSFLRSSSMDELPGLINVLKGDMSLVGPRPLLIEYLPLYSRSQARRHEAMPGITGWAQVNGRNTLQWEEKFKLDVWYVDNRSMWLDIKILWLTVRKVLIRDGISAAGEATMPRFTGSSEEVKQ